MKLGWYIRLFYYTISFMHFLQVFNSLLTWTYESILPLLLIAIVSIYRLSVHVYFENLCVARCKHDLGLRTSLAK